MEERELRLSTLLASSQFCCIILHTKREGERGKEREKISTSADPKSWQGGLLASGMSVGNGRQSELSLSSA